MKYYQQVMAYWISDNVVICRMFPASLGESALKWFTWLPANQIESFKELVEKFTVRFINNNQIVKGSKALLNLRKRKKETLREYSSRYWEVYQETENCDLKFALNTLKCDSLRDKNNIYNSLIRLPSYTLDKLLARINEYARVENDEAT